MLTVARLSANNLSAIKPLYSQFQRQAADDYGWDTAPVPYDFLELAIHKGLLEGYRLEDPAKGVVGFCLYKLEDHAAVEINVIYLADGVPPKAALDVLMRRLLKDLLTRPGWDVISFALLGKQGDLIHTITWYGFKPVGQSIVRFNMLDPVCTQVLKNQEQLPPLPAGYRLQHWDDSRAAQVAEVVYQAFHTKSDAAWDPRFRTREGANTVVELIQNNEMGTHLKTCTSLLLREADNQVVGFCFLLQTEVTKGNVPLIGILPQEAGKGFGNQLMRHTLFACIRQILDGRIGMAEINATVDTDNFAALHMYRRFGFIEEVNYPHVFLPRQLAASLQPGNWCAVPPA